MADILFVILVVLVSAYLMSEIFRYLKLPRVIGQILAGVVLSIPPIKNYLFDFQSLSVFDFLTNMGIILLFFFVGLEIDLKQFHKNAKESTLISIFNTLLPLTLGFAVSRGFFGFDNITSLIIGISLAVSSQAISLDILEELNLLKSKIGNLIITSGTVDDVFELVAISTVLVIFEAAVGGHSTLQRLFVNIFIFVLVIMIFRATLIPFILKTFEKDKSKAILFMGSLLIVLFMAYLSQLLGISSLIGALIAGILVRQTLLSGSSRKPWEKNEISHTIYVISFGFLIPIFFVNVGLQTDFDVITANLGLAAILLVVDIIGTLGGTVIGVLLSKKTVVEGLTVGWGIMAKGDTELVIATVALHSGLITIDVYTAIITVAIATTFIAPIVFKALIRRHIRVKHHSIRIVN